MAKHRPFRTQDDCRKAIAWVFRQVEANQLEVAKGRTLIYAALSISQILSEHDLERRLAVLEAAAQGVQA